MKRKRIYAGICPRCKSPLTGRLKKGRDGEKYMANGNVFVLSSNPGDYSCACAVCGVKWAGPVYKIEVSDEELDSLNKEWRETVIETPEKSEREILHELLQDEGFDPIPQKAKKRGIIGFVGRMFKDTLLSPITTVKGFMSDVSDTALEYDFKPVKEDEAPDSEEQSPESSYDEEDN